MGGKESLYLAYATTPRARPALGCVCVCATQSICRILWLRMGLLFFPFWTRHQKYHLFVFSHLSRSRKFCSLLFCAFSKSQKYWLLLRLRMHIYMVCLSSPPRHTRPPHGRARVAESGRREGGGDTERLHMGYLLAMP